MKCPADDRAVRTPAAFRSDACAARCVEDKTMGIDLIGDRLPGRDRSDPDAAALGLRQQRALKLRTADVGGRRATRGNGLAMAPLQMPRFVEPADAERNWRDAVFQQQGDRLRRNAFDVASLGGKTDRQQIDIPPEAARVEGCDQADRTSADDYHGRGLGHQSPFLRFTPDDRQGGSIGRKRGSAMLSKATRKPASATACASGSIVPIMATRAALTSAAPASRPFS